MHVSLPQVLYAHLHLQRKATDGQRASVKKKRVKELRNKLENAPHLLDETKALLHRDVLGMTVLDLAFCICQDEMGIASDALYAEVLDVLLPPLLARIKVDPGLAYVNGVDPTPATPLYFDSIEGRRKSVKVTIGDKDVVEHIYEG